MNKPLRIRAFWSVYGPRLHANGRRIELSDTDSWNIAAFDLLAWMERNGVTQIEFYGPCSKEAKDAFAKANS